MSIISRNFNRDIVNQDTFQTFSDSQKWESSLTQLVDIS